MCATLRAVDHDGAPGARDPRPSAHPVVATGLVLVVLQVCARAWASYGSWFSGDDFNLMARLYDVPLTLGELMTPHDSQLMPGGIFFAWVMANAGPLNWTVGATILVGLQAFASLSCLLMLVTVFGRRWAVIPLLLLYLASPLTLTSYMWWAAAINQVPLQGAFFLTVTAAVLYFRTRRPAWLVLTLAAVLLGTLFYVKAVLFLPVVAAVAFLFFGPAGTRALRSALVTLRRYAPLWGILAAAGLGYSLYYTLSVESPLEGYDVAWAPLADNFFRVSLGPGLVGGPWRWWNPIPPNGLVDPPSWAITATWIALAVSAYWLHQRGRARWRALLVLGGYLLAIFVLMAVGRAVVVGSVAALELRYLADATPVAVLTLGLLLLDVRVPHHSPATVQLDGVDWRSRRGVVPLAVGGALLAGAVLSTVRYVGLWHADYDAKVYTRNVAASARFHDLWVADGWVPTDVVSPLRTPDNYISRVFRQFPSIHAVTEGTDLSVLDELGIPHPAGVDPALASLPGRPDRCAFPVGTDPVEVPLDEGRGTEPLGTQWWVSVDYLSGQDAQLDLQVGDTRGEHRVEQGLHRLLVRGEGPVDQVVMRTASSDVALCVDEVRVGEVQEWEASP